MIYSESLIVKFLKHFNPFPVEGGLLLCIKYLISYCLSELKDIFFYPEEMAVQIHPKESEYVHGIGGLDNVLHLWRCIDDKWEMLRNK